MDPTRENLTDAQALKFVREILALESNRIIKKCIAESEFFYRTFCDSDGIPRKDSSIRLADVLAMTFLQIKFRPVFEFIRNNISLVLDTEYVDNWLRYSKIRDKYKEDNEPFRLTRWIQTEISVSGNKIDLMPNAEIIEKIFAMSLRCFYSIMCLKFDVDKIPNSMVNSTSDPQVLWDFLRSVDSGKKSERAGSVEIYWQHIKGDEILKGLEYSELIKYARWIRTVANVSPSLNLDVAKRIRSIWDDSGTFAQYELFDSLRYEGSTHFCFQLLEVFEKLELRKDAPEILEAKMLLEGFLTDQNIDSGSKVSVIGSFCNERKQSDINFRLCRAFDNIADEKTRSAVRFVFDQINSRYIDGTEDIFSKEENFFYVLYQNWSGNPDNSQEIEGIHKAVKRSLKNHPRAVEHFWKSFPFRETWGSTQDMLDDSKFHSAFPNEFGRCLYVSLSDLIDITRQADIQDPILQRKVDWWFNCMNDKTVKDRLRVRPDGTTLRSILVEK